VGEDHYLVVGTLFNPFRHERARSASRQGFRDSLCSGAKCGALVKKNELLTQVWADSFVEENNLNKCIHTVRRALGRLTVGSTLLKQSKNTAFVLLSKFAVEL